MKRPGQVVALAAGAAAALLLARRRRRERSRTKAGSAPLVDVRHRGGSGSPMLLLHGVGGTWHAWDPVLTALEARHDVLAPSLLGHGGATPIAPGVETTLDALVDGLEAELDHAGLDRVHIVGNSLGGWLAIELARRGRARSLVLFSPAGAWTSQRRINAVTLAIRVSFSVLARQATHADLIVAIPWLRRALLSSQVAHPERFDPQALVANIRASAHAPAVGPLLRALPLLRLEPLPPDTARPIRVVWAEPDRVIPFKWFGAPLVERLPGAELIRQPGIGHVPMSDEPATVVRLILEVTTAVDGTGPDVARSAR